MDVTKTELIKLPVTKVPYQCICLDYDKLTVQQLHDVFQLRAAVFVVEQQCVYQDIDGWDNKAQHLLIFEQQELVAYARLFARGIQHAEYAIIGRVVVSQTHRLKGLGHQLMEKAVTALSKKGKTPPVKISAQSHLKAFYEKHHFQATGKAYLEDGIPHIEMIRSSVN